LSARPQSGAGTEVDNAQAKTGPFTLSNGIAVVGALVWAGLSYWHERAFENVPLKGDIVGWAFAVFPVYALFFHGCFFWISRTGEFPAKMKVALVSLAAAAGLAALEIANGFHG
jgi:hypothetical protein